MTRYSYEQRITRAQDLAAKYSFAAELLGFYARIAGVQQSIAGAISATVSLEDKTLNGGELPDEVSDVLCSFAPGLVQLARTQGPAALQQAVDFIDGRKLLTDFWAERATQSPAERFFALALLQPYAEALAQTATADESSAATCPLCGSEPVVGVLRPELQGARRSLVCSLCAHEWDFARAVCPACGESRPEALGVYTAQQLPHIRVEACDTCRRYLKSVDLTQDGRAVPVVEELASVPLDLWAGEHGYVKLCANLLGL